VSGLTPQTTYTFTVRTKTSPHDTQKNTLYSAFTSGMDGTTIAAFGAPPNFSATGTSTSNVALSWIAVSTATSYEIYRNGAFLTSVTTNAHNDATAGADSVYLYKVRALKTGSTSAFSSVDPATTVMFTDSSPSGATIQAVHLTELRTAVNSLRVAVGLSAATFTDSSLVGVAIKALHITELRDALDVAREAAVLTTLSYTDPTITAGTTTASAAHATELRGGLQ